MDRLPIRSLFDFLMTHTINTSFPCILGFHFALILRGVVCPELDCIFGITTLESKPVHLIKMEWRASRRTKSIHVNGIIISLSTVYSQLVVTICSLRSTHY